MLKGFRIYFLGLTVSLMLASTASATPVTVDLTGVNYEQTINAHFGASINATINAEAGYYELIINGVTPAVNSFCVDPSYAPPFNTNVSYYNVAIISPDAHNYDQAAYLYYLAQTIPNVDVAAVQAAIWETVMDAPGYNDFTWNYNSSSQIYKDYTAYLKDLNDVLVNGKLPSTSFGGFNLANYSLVVSPASNYYGNNYQDYIIYTPVPGGGSTPVPEPGTVILLGSGLVGLALYGRKRANR